ncbi:alpha-beta hydrolase superfamily lysophospholipase [Salsuginibacillus halophilus]|uniref:Alpha-beta hydrolase superfamily lysophospholipase n=1 Tax=Salsuginibacillus halophilus TaxID=517424 RepID=A0A2P8HBI3_9BACI|nr:alpha/beta fold hydrolase [Salsuginibacillus halophilus]PSL43587.1 alpha-beta hydrolase superfamily lysophospholipase [Salsuginibacillus halophilus]
MNAVNSKQTTAPFSLKALEESATERLRYRTYYQLPDTCEHKVTHIRSNNEILALQLYQPDQVNGRLYMLHGYFDHTGVLGRFITYALAQGMEVCTVDFPGHGLSSGARYTVDDFNHYEDALQALFQVFEHPTQNYILAGHSTGAGIAARHVLKNELPGLERLQLAAPLLRSANWKSSRLLYHAAKAWVTEVPRRFRENSGDEVYLAEQKQDPLQHTKIPLSWLEALFRWEKEFHDLAPSDVPVDIFQGGRDQTVDWKQNLEAYSEKFTQSQTYWLPEGRHQLLNDAEPIRRIVYRLMKQNWV